VGEMDLLGARRLHKEEKIEEIIFAVTSANQANSRYNPVPFWARVIAIDRFARTLKERFDISCRIVGIPHYPPSEHYVEVLLKEIRENTYDRLSLTPENSLVLCSTPALSTHILQKV